MTRMTGPDCVVMCNLINTHTHTYTHLEMVAIAKVTEWLQERLGVEGPASRWSWARTTDGRAASGNGYHRAHSGPTGDEGCGSTGWNITVPARFLTGGG